MVYYARVEYLEFNKANFFTVILLPEKNGSFPVVIMRTPYVKNETEKSDYEVMHNCLESFKTWLERGYAVVFQHCRGQGKSTGEFVPYIHEREDGLALREWVRNQPFYNGEIFLCGGSYTASLHYSTSPFESDVKGAVFEVQDTERYRLWYRNGQMRKGHANWHFALYKSKGGLNKNFSMKSFARLPLKGLSEKVLGDRADDFEQMLFSPYPTDSFWQTRFGGVEASGATDNAEIPILLTTGYNDFYVGGIFKMWHSMSENTKKNCALLVSPYNHGDGYSETEGLFFPNGKRAEQFGNNYQIDWFDNIRLGASLPYNKGEITYYRTFENCWQNDFYLIPTKPTKVALGSGVVSFSYNPLNPPAFNCEGNFLKSVDGRSDLINLYLPPFDKDVFIKGQIKAQLTVSSDCYDTSFYMNLSIEKPNGDYVLRHDITSILYQFEEYKPNNFVTLNFSFDEHAFLLKKGERLRVVIAATDDNTYVCHTNQKGLYCLQTNKVTAINKVDLSRSVLTLPVED